MKQKILAEVKNKSGAFIYSIKENFNSAPKKQPFNQAQQGT